jgi:transcriptional regulator with XRE-family HTH domain
LLVQHRNAVGLTQEQLAERSGVSVRAISDLERGRSGNPQRRSVQALAGALDLDDTAVGEFTSAARAGDPRPRPPVQAATSPRPVVVPRQLPPDVDWLIGQDDILKQIHHVADGCVRGAWRAAPVMCVSGPPGAGKTSLAVRAGYDCQDAFPDGQLFVDLRGFGTERATPGEVLGWMLGGLGVPEQLIPLSLDERVSLYRSRTRQLRLLVILDNAADEAQVSPLLPTGARCLVLVTSRRLLAGIEGATLLSLGMLDDVSAARLFTALVGYERVAAEPERLGEVVALCGGLPLALSVLARRLETRPGWTLTDIVTLSGGERLSVLSAGDIQVRNVFDISYRQLEPTVARLFRRLGVAPEASIDIDLAATLAEVDWTSALAMLESLVDVSLVQGVTDDRYRLHGLLRLFALERLAKEEPGAVEPLGVMVDDWLLRSGRPGGHS